ncbi:uncharacterized transposon-derived protein F54H12.3 [Trichonephila inaurata madagascariensis]|uniref:Uncharacterized transposon-derived protein F54H12.3 n=1 Tax=Trichonephila inaurata madagascariensis TaxID=2747483 RepID=A0A8X7CAJ6_9ARAC|nr:uncharacterized transposon-derived protein F54H12.3 [Trichonephila inaurata madagascariensis]
MKVGFFTTNNKANASIVERFNHTLKTKMWKYFTEMNTKCYIDVVGKLVYSYNHTWYRSIRMEPSSVSEGNQTQVWLTLYGKSLKESQNPYSKRVIPCQSAEKNLILKKVMNKIGREKFSRFTKSFLEIQ